MFLYDTYNRNFSEDGELWSMISSFIFPFVISYLEERFGAGLDNYSIRCIYKIYTSEKNSTILHEMI